MTAVTKVRVEQPRVKRFYRELTTLGAMLMLGSLRSWAQNPPSGPTVTLGIEVSMADSAVFYIPAVGDGEMLGIIPFPEGRFAGVRITPHMRADSVQIEVSALAKAKKKLSEASCDEVESWKSEDAGSYDAKNDASVSLSGLGRLSLPVFKVKVVPATGHPTPSRWQQTYANSLAFCGCNYPQPRSIILPEGTSVRGAGGTLSHPDAGKCVQISGCGQCCRTTIPGAVQNADR